MGKLSEKIKSTVKREAGYIGKGAKMVGHAAKEAAKERIEEAREQHKAEAEARKVAKGVELQAYKEELTKQESVKAVERGKARAVKAVTGGSGWRTTLNELGKIGNNLSGTDVTGGRGMGNNMNKNQSVGSYLLEGMDTMTPQTNRQQGRSQGRQRVAQETQIIHEVPSAASHLFEGLNFGQNQGSGRRSGKTIVHSRKVIVVNQHSRRHGRRHKHHRR